MLLIAVGLTFIFTGLIAELIISIGGRHADEKPYAVKTVLRRRA